VQLCGHPLKDVEPCGRQVSCCQCIYERRATYIIDMIDKNVILSCEGLSSGT